MKRKEYDQLNSDGNHACPDCGSKQTKPYPGCHCPMNTGGYGTRHINEYHHRCEVVERGE